MPLFLQSSRGINIYKLQRREYCSESYDTDTDTDTDIPQICWQKMKSNQFQIEITLFRVNKIISTSEMKQLTGKN